MVFVPLQAVDASCCVYRTQCGMITKIRLSQTNSVNLVPVNGHT